MNRKVIIIGERHSKHAALVAALMRIEKGSGLIMFCQQTEQPMPIKVKLIPPEIFKTKQYLDTQPSKFFGKPKNNYRKK